MITKNGGKGIDRGESRDDLTEKKDEERNGEIISRQEGGLALDIGDQVEVGDDNGESVDKMHFGEFEQLRVLRGEKEGGKEKKK